MARIMIIDDDAAAVENLTMMLESHGYEICALDTIDGAIGVIEKTRPDLLILDIMFPSNPAGGFDLARTVRQTRAIKKLPIILLTSINDEFPMGFSSHDMEPEWMPVQAFIEKPVDIASLLNKIKSLLELAGKA